MQKEQLFSAPVCLCVCVVPNRDLRKRNGVNTCKLLDSMSVQHLSCSHLQVEG